MDRLVKKVIFSIYILEIDIYNNQCLTDILKINHAIQQ